jgi:hypothetical protein
VVLALLVAASPQASWGQSSGYWLIGEITGRWEYRVGTAAPEPLTKRYTALVPAGQLRCQETDLARCELRFLVDPRSGVTERLDVRLEQTGKWVNLRGLTPPPPPVVPTTATELVKKFTRVTRAGGSRSVSGCGGDFPLRAPVCGENVDASGLTVRWAPAGEDASSKLMVLVERVDGQPQRFRGTASESAGAFADETLDRFLHKVQAPNEAVDVVVRVQADGGRNAVRLVHLLPASRTEPFTARLQQAALSQGASKTLTAMSMALDEDMWSRAAEEARTLIGSGGASARVLELALAGLCQSDFEEEKALLKKRIPPKRYSDICGAASGTAAAPAAPAAAAAPTAPLAPAAPAAAPEGVAPAPDPSGEAMGAALARPRLGIALLIGNWDYWNVPLNSVKEDLRNMSQALGDLGFSVTVKENLRNPRQFIDALNQTLERENASAGDVLLVYYSGHGVQIDGRSHFLTTGVSDSAKVAEDVRDNAQSTEDLLAEMERSLPGTRILFVEACRNDLFSSRGGASVQPARGGFAFQQDDVPNTFVMFANKPGATTAVRSSTGLMGPFTEAFIYALQNSTGEILDVYDVAAKKAVEFSPGQEPVMYRSKAFDSVVLRRGDQKAQDNRARTLLNDAETLYRDRAWDQFREMVDRGRALAADSDLRARLAQEVEFARFVVEAETAEQDDRWADAAAAWEKAAELFPARQWVTMKTATSYLLGDDVVRAVRSLATLGAQSEGELSLQANQLLASLVKAFPALEADARKTAEAATRVSGMEFERLDHEE